MNVPSRPYEKSIAFYVFVNKPWVRECGDDMMPVGLGVSIGSIVDIDLLRVH
jgi:hypothetical protein